MSAPATQVRAGTSTAPVPKPVPNKTVTPERERTEATTQVLNSGKEESAPHLRQSNETDVHIPAFLRRR